MYKYKTKPYEHQEKIFADSWCRKYFGLFMEMGTGKSKVAIDTMGRLFLEDKIKASEEQKEREEIREEKEKNNRRSTSRRSTRQNPLVKVLTSATFIRSALGILKKFL